MKTRQEYVDLVSRPGKFEGEPAYVPYFWEFLLEGGEDFEDGPVVGFYVSAEDKILFPELKNRRTVKIMEMDSGFVVEVT